MARSEHHVPKAGWELEAREPEPDLTPRSPTSHPADSVRGPATGCAVAAPRSARCHTAPSQTSRAHRRLPGLRDVPARPAKLRPRSGGRPHTPEVDLTPRRPTSHPGGRSHTPRTACEVMQRGAQSPRAARPPESLHSPATAPTSQSFWRPHRWPNFCEDAARSTRSTRSARSTRLLPRGCSASRSSPDSMLTGGEPPRGAAQCGGAGHLRASQRAHAFSRREQTARSGGPPAPHR